MIAVSGFGFWLLAARVTSPAAVGLAAGALSLGTLASFVSQAGLPHVLLRFAAPDAAGAALARAAVLAVIVLTLVGGVAVVGAARVAGSPVFLLAPPLVMTALIVCGAVGVSLLISALNLHAALGGRATVSWTGGIVAVVKLVTVIPLAAAAAGLGIVLAWLISVLVASLASLAWAERRLPEARPSMRALRVHARYALATYAADLVSYTPTHGALGWLAPLIVLSRFGSERAGVFYLVWSVAAMLNAAPAAFGVAMIAGRGVPRWLRSWRAWLAAIVLYGGGIALTAALADPLLRVVGEVYARQGAGLLLALAATSGVVALNAVIQSVLRVRRAERSVAAHGLVIGIGAVVALMLAPSGGSLLAVAAAWTAVQAVGALVGFALLRSQGVRAPAGKPPPPSLAAEG